MIILASASPRRRELLNTMGIRDFAVRPSSREEPYDASLGPGGAVERIALGKALDAAAGADAGDIVIGADTLVFLDGRPLGKPRDKEDARAMLSALSGREHTVITGLAVIAGDYRETGHTATAVRFRALTAREIEWYIRSGEPMDKAGAYGIQGLGGLLVEGVNGDYPNVVGLPTGQLSRMLERAGYSVFEG